MWRRPIVIGNWKMHTTAAEAVMLARGIAQAVEQFDDLDVVLCPPVIWLPSLVEELHHRPRTLAFGVQNIYPAASGPFTGETGLAMIRGLADYVIIGHSERRAYFQETDRLIHDKLVAVLDAGLTPIFCVGELTPVMLKTRGRGRPTVLQRESDLVRQLTRAVADLAHRSLEKLILCYEPLWAISPAAHVPGAHAAAVLDHLRDFLIKQVGGTAVARIRTIYGGSVTADTIDEYTAQPGIDGVMVGGASLARATFLPIVEAVADRARHRPHPWDHEPRS